MKSLFRDIILLLGISAAIWLTIFAIAIAKILAAIFAVYYASKLLLRLTKYLYKIDKADSDSKKD